MADIDPFKSIEAAWFAIRDNFDRINQKLKAGNDRDDLLADRDGARDAYYLALAKQFDASDAFVIKTTKALKQSIDDLNDMLNDLKKIKQILLALTSVVQMAAALAAMVVL